MCWIHSDMMTCWPCRSVDPPEMAVVAPGSRQVWASNHSPHYACIHLESSWTSLEALLTLSVSIFNLDEDEMIHVGLSKTKFPNNWSNDQDLFVRTSEIVSVLSVLFKYNLMMSNQTITNCSRKVRKIESGSWQRWQGQRGWWMIICKRPVPSDIHL